MGMGGYLDWLEKDEITLGPVCSVNATHGHTDGGVCRYCQDATVRAEKAAAASAAAVEKAEQQAAWEAARVAAEKAARAAFFKGLSAYLKDRRVPVNVHQGLDGKFAGYAVTLSEELGVSLTYAAHPSANQRSVRIERPADLAAAVKVIGNYNPVLDEVLSLIRKFWK